MQKCKYPGPHHEDLRGAGKLLEKSHARARALRDPLVIVPAQHPFAELAP
jgi:hypothetical protein